MATTAALLAFTPATSPNPNPNFARRFSAAPLALLPSPRSRFHCASARRLRLSAGHLALDGSIRRGHVVAALHDESTHSDIEVEKEDLEPKPEGKDAEEAWKETLETFKQEALKMKEISQETYEVYSKKAMVILKETSETLMIQADKAREDLTIITKQISEEGKVYLSTAAENSPDSIKDVVETFASSPDELKEMSAVRDFYLGIPYGAFLSIGGFLLFMLTGSIPAIRFGIILGSALLALSIASLRSWKSGKSSPLLLKGQAAIAAIIFLRHWRLLGQKQLFSTAVMTLISGGMLAFYVYRIMIDGGSKGPTPEQSSEKQTSGN